MRFQRLVALAILLPALLLSSAIGSARAGSVSFNVSVNTASLNGQAGYLDVQFNPGGPGAATGSAALLAFTSDGSQQPSAPLNGVSGDVSGTLPDALTLTNSTAFNDFFEGFVYGNTIQFELTLSGPAAGSSTTPGSSFAFSLYDDTGSIPLLTTDPNGSVLTVNVNADGSTSVETFPQSPNDNARGYRQRGYRSGAGNTRVVARRFASHVDRLSPVTTTNRERRDD
jgi:hypothetical protein